jgi:hypothetical protein
VVELEHDDGDDQPDCAEQQLYPPVTGEREQRADDGAMARGSVEFPGDFLESLCVFGHGVLLLAGSMWTVTGVTPASLS